MKKARKMTGFEPHNPGVGSDHSAKSAKTTAQDFQELKRDNKSFFHVILFERWTPSFTEILVD